MEAAFTPQQKKILQGQASKLAEKHLCSQKYVKLIIEGDRKIKSELSTKVYEDLLKLIELLSPTQPNQ